MTDLKLTLDFTAKHEDLQLWVWCSRIITNVTSTKFLNLQNKISNAMLKLSPTLLQPEFCSWLKRCDAWVLLFKLLEHSMSTWSAIVVSYCTIQYSSFEFICKFKFILCLIGIYYLCMYVWIYLLPNLGFIGSQEIFLGWGWLHISRWSPSPSSVGGVLSLLNVHYCTKCKPGLWKAYSTLSCRFVSSFPHCSQWVFNNQYWVAVWAVTKS